MDPPRKFSSKDEETEYWKKLAQQFKEELDETKEELEEFQISSHELEQELETQLKHEEKKRKELETTSSRLQNECDSLKDKLQKLHSDSHKRLTELEDSLAKAEAIKNEHQKYVRELEQVNDDLERAKRATVVSLEDFEQRLNEAIERNAFLESELDEKEALLDTVQRLKDEARDLKSELGVRKPSDVHTKSNDVNSSAQASSVPQPMQDSGYSAQVVTPTTPTTPRGVGTPTTSNGTANGTSTGTPLTPSARISALNIVGDLLRKVGALESKLATCRNFVRDEPRSKSGTSPLNSPRSELMLASGSWNQRTKRLNRGSSLPVQQGVKMTV